MKKILFFASTIIFFGLTPDVFAQGFVPLAPITGLTDPTTAESVINSQNLADFFNNLYKYLIGVAAILAVIEIIWGGLEYSTQDSISAKGAGKQRIFNAIGGLVLVLSPVLVFSIINPSILNLSLNLPKLDTVSGTGTNFSGSGAQTSIVDSTTAAAIAAGCTVTGTLLKTAVCPTQQAAQDFATNCTTGSGNVPFFTTQYKATCDTTSGSVTGSYAFADTSQSTGFIGKLNMITGYSYYEPLASTPTNPNNGNAVLQFASACTADGGTTCMGSVKLPCAFSTTACWLISLSCTDGETGAGGCSSNPQFTVIK